MNQQTMGCSRKKTKQGGGVGDRLRIYFSEKEPGIFKFATLSWHDCLLRNSKEKGRRFHWKFYKIGWHPEIPRSKTKTHGNSIWVFLEHPCNFHFCYSWPLESAILIVYGSVAATVFIMPTAICLLTWKPPIHIFLMAGVNLLL